MSKPAFFITAQPACILQGHAHVTCAACGDCGQVSIIGCVAEPVRGMQQLYDVQNCILERVREWCEHHRERCRLLAQEAREGDVARHVHFSMN